jgi:hypothetical protein
MIRSIFDVLFIVNNSTEPITLPVETALNVVAGVAASHGRPGPRRLVIHVGSTGRHVFSWWCFPRPLQFLRHAYIDELARLEEPLMGAVTDTFPGILAIFNNVAAGREAEFEEWFQHEHLAERLAVPGFLIGRRHEAISGQPRYFNFYVTQSVEVLKSAAYLGRLDEPTPMTRTVMLEIFKDMIRTVCRRTFRLGAMRGTGVVTVRFGERPAETALRAAIERLMRDKAVACGEVWRAADPLEFPVSLEERLRGGDRKIEMCLLVETLRVPEAEKIAAALANEFPSTEVGVYRLLCEIRP